MESAEEPEDVLDYSLIANKRLIVEYLKCKKKSDQDVAAFWERNFLLTGYRNGRAIVFANNKVQIENDQGILEETIMNSKEELESLLFESFPVLKCPEVSHFLDIVWTAKYGSSL